MTYQLPNPLRALLGYMRGDDIRAANDQILARNLAERAAGAAPASTTPPTSPSPMEVKAAVTGA